MPPSVTENITVSSWITLHQYNIVVLIISTLASGSASVLVNNRRRNQASRLGLFHLIYTIVRFYIYLLSNRLIVITKMIRIKWITRITRTPRGYKDNKDQSSSLTIP